MLKLVLAVAGVLLALLHSVNGEVSLARVEMQGIFDLVRRFFPKDKNNGIGGCKKGECAIGATFVMPGSNEPLASPLGRPDMTGIEDENGNTWQDDSKKAGGDKRDAGATTTSPTAQPPSAPVPAAPPVATAAPTAAPIATAAPVTVAPETAAPATVAQVVATSAPAVLTAAHTSGGGAQPIDDADQLAGSDSTASSSQDAGSGEHIDDSDF